MLMIRLHTIGRTHLDLLIAPTHLVGVSSKSLHSSCFPFFELLMVGAWRRDETERHFDFSLFFPLKLTLLLVQRITMSVSSGA